jgi:hypothetical protein
MHILVGKSKRNTLLGETIVGGNMTLKWIRKI